MAKSLSTFGMSASPSWPASSSSPHACTACQSSHSMPRVQISVLRCFFLWTKLCNSPCLSNALAQAKLADIASCAKSSSSLFSPCTWVLVFFHRARAFPTRKVLCRRMKSLSLFLIHLPAFFLRSGQLFVRPEFLLHCPTSSLSPPIPHVRIALIENAIQKRCWGKNERTWGGPADQSRALTDFLWFSQSALSLSLHCGCSALVACPTWKLKT